MSKANDKSSSGRRLAVTIGNKKVLVIHETRNTFSNEVASDSIFGTIDDPVNLVSQTAACSYNQLTYSKYDGGNSLVKEGVLTVSVPSESVGAPHYGFTTLMLNEAKRMLGVTELTDIVDYVMVCVPPGTVEGTSGWGAYANINSWLSGKWNVLLIQRPQLK